MEERGESIPLARVEHDALGHEPAAADGTDDPASVDIVKAFRNKRPPPDADDAREPADQPRGTGRGFGMGTKGGSTLVEGRNDRALSVLDT
jgi:hypothetical protein